MIKTILQIALIFIVLTGSAISAPQPSIDFLHFWISPGEQDSLAVVSDAFKARGGNWSASPTKNYEYMKHEAWLRISNGFPPTAMLWLSGGDVLYMANMGIAEPVNRVIGNENWQHNIRPFTLDVATVNQQVMGLPMSIHNENWAWYNNKIYRTLNLPFPKTWDEFLTQAPKISAAGYLPIAVSDSDFTIRILFSVLLAGVDDSNAYHRFYSEQDATLLDAPSFQHMLTTFAGLRKYATHPGVLPTWSDATSSVITGRAAMQIMGDWAKGEFIAAHKKLGRDYQCAPAPDAQHTFLAAIDVIAFPIVKTEAEKSGQRLLAQVILDPKVQVGFANKKGSIPAILNFDKRGLDQCARNSLELLADTHSRLYSPRMLMSEQMNTDLQNIVANFWKTPNLTTTDLTNALKAQFAHHDMQNVKPIAH